MNELSLVRPLQVHSDVATWSIFEPFVTLIEGLEVIQDINGLAIVLGKYKRESLIPAPAPQIRTQLHPMFKPSHMPTPPQPHLILYSHGRSPPLNPPPDLKYDLRSIPNPPKALRDVSDGRSKRLREHLLSMSEFTDKLDDVEREAREAMGGKVTEHEALGSPESSDQLDGEEDFQSISIEQGQDKDFESDQDEDDEDASAHSALILRVGCNCALGHHRSVAFVCELATRPWPRDWVVEVVHRDLERKRAGGKREKQKAVQKGRRRFEGGGGDDEW